VDVRTHCNISFVYHHTPTRRGRIDSQANETQKGFVKDKSWDLKGNLHDARVSLFPR